MQAPYITNIQRFSTKDGAGLRTTVFVKGCPLRCKWCHNPETQRAERELEYEAARCVGCGACRSVCPAGCHGGEKSHVLRRENCAACFQCASLCPSGALSVAGRKFTVEELAAEALRDLPFYGPEGGVTFSGGEPLLYPDYVAACAKVIKAAGATVTIDTCGAVERRAFAAVAGVCDMLLYDVKDYDAARHRENTGGDLDAIVENLRYADSLGIPTRLRLILLAGVNDDARYADYAVSLFRSLRHAQGVDVLAFHPYMRGKYEALGRASACGAERIPSPARLTSFRARIAEGTRGAD